LNASASYLESGHHNTFDSHDDLKCPLDGS
jgi:hypothetical protein